VNLVKLALQRAMQENPFAGKQSRWTALSGVSVTVHTTAQDWLAALPEYSQQPTVEEAIDDPTNKRHYWRWRMEPYWETLLDGEESAEYITEASLGKRASSAFTAAHHRTEGMSCNPCLNVAVQSDLRVVCCGCGIILRLTHVV
jgi:hypothetical protein